MDETLLKILLLHAEYSFAPIDWDFKRLTESEKDLIGNQRVLDRLRKITNEKTGLPLVEVFKDDEEDPFPLFV